MRLLNKLSITINRDNGTKGYWEAGEWVPPINGLPIVIRCNYQPYKETGTLQKALPSGYMAEDSLIVMTKSPIKTVEQFSHAEADRTTINGFEYIAFKPKDWSPMNTRTSHFQVVFVRFDVTTTGGL